MIPTTVGTWARSLKIGTSCALAMASIACGGPGQGHAPGDLAVDCSQLERISDNEIRVPSAGITLTVVSNFESGGTGVGWGSFTDGSFVNSDGQIVGYYQVPDADLDNNTGSKLQFVDLDVPRCANNPDVQSLRVMNIGTLEGLEFTRWGIGYAGRNAIILPTTTTPIPQVVQNENGATVLDASNFDGIAFWARALPGNDAVLRAGLLDRFTYPVTPDEVRFCEEVVPRKEELGEKFVPIFRADTTTDCRDQFSEIYTLTPEWRLYFTEFSDLRQGGWGYDAPFLATFEIWDYLFSIANFETADIQLDDIGFFRYDNLEQNN